MYNLTFQKYTIIHLVVVIIISASMLMANIAYAGNNDSLDGSKFSVHSLKGAYGFALDGLAFNVFDGSTIQAAAIGRFIADGKGNIVDAVRTLNTAGTIQKEKFSGSYTVNPDGTGNFTIYVSRLMPDGSAIPVTIETAEFVMNQPREELQLIGTSITGPNGEDLGLRLVTRGIARQQ